MIELVIRQYLPTDKAFSDRESPIWKKCENILPTREAWKYVTPLLATARKANGFGLSANQVDLDIPLFVSTIEGKLQPCYRPRVICYNPAKGYYSGKEMCLSFPGAAVPVTRPYQVQVDFIAFPNGKHRKIWLEGHEAVGFQHECDHLQGITIFDRYKWQLQAKAAEMAKQITAREATAEPQVQSVIYDPTKD